MAETALSFPHSHPNKETLLPIASASVPPPTASFPSSPTYKDSFLCSIILFPLQALLLCCLCSPLSSSLPFPKCPPPTFSHLPSHCQLPLPCADGPTLNFPCCLLLLFLHVRRTPHLLPLSLPLPSSRDPLVLTLAPSLSAQGSGILGEGVENTPAMEILWGLHPV